ncbi:uridine kinase [Actinosynnema sp. ALI-1.44]|nr:uridine kinase [Actinosynnema sp. ALI-1.44]
MAAPPRLGGVRLLAVDGPSGSGKSTLARRVVERLRGESRTTTLISTDEFATWDNPVAWWSRLEEGVLQPLAHGRAGRYQRTEWVHDIPTSGELITVEVPEVLVLEGVSAGRTAVHARLSTLVWVEFADAAARLERSVTRDGERYRTHLLRWQRFETGWFEVDNPAARAGPKFHPR